MRIICTFIYDVYIYKYIDIYKCIQAYEYKYSCKYVASMNGSFHTYESVTSHVYTSFHKCVHNRKN